MLCIPVMLAADKDVKVFVIGRLELLVSHCLGIEEQRSSKGGFIPTVWGLFDCQSRNNALMTSNKLLWVLARCCFLSRQAMMLRQFNVQLSLLLDSGQTAWFSNFYWISAKQKAETDRELACVLSQDAKTQT